ncbi:MAG: SMP-30/gluconolactonase/LRE family protein [Planctomycetales bacterium]
MEKFGEGLVFDADGWGYVSTGDRIERFTLAGERSTWAVTGGMPLGHVIQPDGTHLVCDVERRAVLHIAADGRELGVASSGTPDFPLRRPNDVELDAHGGFYFSDSAMESNDEHRVGRIFHVDAAGVTRLFDSRLANPNGLALSLDGARLLAAEDWLNRIHEYRLTGPGRAASKRVFANLPAKQGDQLGNQPDTLRLDAEGNLLVAHFGMKRIQVLDRGGRLVGSIPSGMWNTGGLAFAGPERELLFVSGGNDHDLHTPAVLVRIDLSATTIRGPRPPAGSSSPGLRSANR